jgi:hypothetical protein
LVAQYRAELAEAKRLDTPAGQHALFLAEMLAAGKHTASGAASLSREVREAMAVAMKGAGKPDAVDELTARRRARGVG